MFNLYEPKAIEALKGLIKQTDGTPRKKPIPYDAIERYLKVYGSYKKFELVKTKPGEILDAVIKEFCPEHGQSTDEEIDENIETRIRIFLRDNRNAKTIIKNTENEIFPGIY